MFTMLAAFVDVPYTIPIVIICGLSSAFLALTNIKKGYIEAYWKKEDKVLKIPFGEGNKIYV